MLLLLLVVFRGITAAVTPLLMAVVAIAGALLILLGVSHLADISAYSVNVVTMLGLGLAVDYSLLVISRFREERAAGFELPEAIERTLATAGRTVTFSGLTVLDVVPDGPSQGPVATRLVERIRALERPVPAGVTGPAAFLVDYRDSLLVRLPWAFGLIGLVTFVLLFLMTGSVVVPVKAIVMNVLSLGASFGALVWVFQEGHLSGLLGFDAPGMVDITVPVLIFVFAFGLSMDYEVFLLSRIKEAWDQTGDNDRAVALGLQRTGRIVTSAATLIVVVFLGFAAGELLTIEEIGLGMAIAVVLDATVVRMLLVPAAMKLMGRWNWWAPPALRRFHDRHGLAEVRPAGPRRHEDQ